MRYVFDYEETLVRRVEIYADDLGKAINEMHRRINEEEIVLNSEDFAGGKLSMPVAENYMINVTDEGERMSDEAVSCMDIEIDWW